MSVIPLPSFIWLNASSITRRFFWYYSITRTFSLLFAITFFNRCLSRFCVSIVSKFSFLLALRISCFGFSSSAFFFTISNCLVGGKSEKKQFGIMISVLDYVLLLVGFLLFFILVAEHNDFHLNLVRVVDFLFVENDRIAREFWRFLDFFAEFLANVEME